MIALVTDRLSVSKAIRSRVDAVVKALAFHQCVPGSITGLGVICGLNLLVLYSATPVFPSSQKPTFDLRIVK